MTDQEIVALVAEKVMGWHVVEKEKSGHDCYCLTPHGGHIFDPLNSDSDSCIVLDRMIELGWDYTLGVARRISGGDDTRIVCDFCKPPYKGYRVVETDRKRAIVLAALRAVGVKVEK